MQPHTQRIIAYLAAALGLALLGSGLLISDDMQWRLQLLAGLWLLSLLPRAPRQRQAPVVVHGLGLLMIVCMLGFIAVALQLVRDQISQSGVIRSQVAMLYTPQGSQHPDSAASLRPADRTALGSGRRWPIELEPNARGKILDRNGSVLARTDDGRRIYPYPDLAHIVGFQSRLYGTSAVEDRFDRYLSGAYTLSPSAVLETQLLGTPFQIATADVRLTIDLQLQEVAQTALGDRLGAVVLLDPQTGAILALVSYPRFDPNRLILPPRASQTDLAQVQAAWQELTTRTDSPLLNRATQGRYPPGSVIKTLTAAAALDSGLLTGPEGRVTCPEQLPTEAGAPPVRNAVANLMRFTGDPSDLRRIFAFSCNTAFAQLGLALGDERFAAYAARFGLDYANAVSPTSMLRDIPADAGTIAGSAAFLKRPAALADTAFGQGQALVTPLDMALMVAVVANDGMLMRPFLVQEARTGTQLLYSAQPEALRQVISSQAAQQLRSVMQTSVEIGYANPVAIQGTTIGAKTGTAENPSGPPHSWFVALAPVEKPRFAIAVIVEHGGEGSRAALPVARQVLAAALRGNP